MALMENSQMHCAVCRLARGQLRGPVGSAHGKGGMSWVDVVQLLLYCVAYVMSTLCTPLDDQLTVGAHGTACRGA